MTVAARVTAVAAAVALAAIHLVIVPEHLEEKFYVGVLFLVGSVLLLAAAGALLVPRARPAGATLAVAVAAGMFVAYVLSRTVGLPQGYLEGWDDPLGTASLVLDVVLVVAAVASVRSTAAARSGRHSRAGATSRV